MSKALLHKGVPVILGLFLICFIIFTNPNDLSVQFLMVPVLLIFLIAFSLFDMVVGRLKFFSASQKKRRIFSIVSAFGIAVYFILQSIGAMSVGEVMLVAILVTISLFYVARY